MSTRVKAMQLPPFPSVAMPRVFFLESCKVWLRGGWEELYVEMCKETYVESHRKLCEEPCGEPYG